MSSKWLTPGSRTLLTILAAIVLISIGQARPASGAVEPAKAEITVVVPADAELFFDGDATTQTGTERLFVTPALTSGIVYHYTLVARWKTGDKTIEQKRIVDVTSGGRVRVDFLKSTDAKDDAAEDKEAVTSTVTKRPSAAAVNFRQELNLPFATLGTLGKRVSEARRAGDPVALANAASELAVSEKVSGKKAALTSGALLQESTELAKLRRQESELEAVIQVSKQLGAEERAVTQLRQMAAKAKEQTKLEGEAMRNNGEVPWTPRKLVINNTSSDSLDIYVNGNFKMTVGPGEMQACAIEHRWNPTIVTAYGNQDDDIWGPMTINGRFQKYTWNIK